MTIYSLIEIIGSLAYLINKILLSLGKRIGWLFGIVGSIGFTIVTLHKASYAYAILEFTCGIIYIFGLVLWNRSDKVQKNVTFLMSGIALLGIVLVSVFNLGSPNWILENSEVVLFSIGTVLLVLKKPAGWILYGLGHLILAAYAYQLGTYFIMILQVVSLPFTIIGYRRLRSKS